MIVKMSLAKYTSLSCHPWPLTSHRHQDDGEWLQCHGEEGLEYDQQLQQSTPGSVRQQTKHRLTTAERAAFMQWSWTQYCHFVTPIQSNCLHCWPLDDVLPIHLRTPWEFTCCFQLSCTGISEQDINSGEESRHAHGNNLQFVSYFIT